MSRTRCLLFFLASLLAGCSLHELREDLATPLTLAVIGGRVETPLAAPVRVAALHADATGSKPAHDVLLRTAGEFELFVPAGRYRVLAFADVDGDAQPDADEPAAQLDELIVHAGEWRMDLVLQLGAARPAALGEIGALLAQQDTLAGARADLDDVLHSHDYSLSVGYWDGAEFLREIGSNVHVLEAYDPARVPVLFVYGARGDPQDWRYLIGRLDRKRFQPWLYHYPSGVPARITAPLLARKLASLQRQYRFTKLHVVAHSAGGLLVRRMLIASSEPMPWLTRFVSIATPWGGEPNAAFGVRNSPVVVPAWEDIMPDGAFIASLYAKPLPQHVEQILLYGRRTGWPLFLADSDGTIPLTSLRDSRALADAHHIEAFDETHRSILDSPRLAARLDVLLGR